MAESRFAIRNGVSSTWRVVRSHIERGHKMVDWSAHSGSHRTPFAGCKEASLRRSNSVSSLRYERDVLSSIILWMCGLSVVTVLLSPTHRHSGRAPLDSMAKQNLG